MIRTGAWHGKEGSRIATFLPAEEQRLRDRLRDMTDRHLLRWIEIAVEELNLRKKAPHATLLVARSLDDSKRREVGLSPSQKVAGPTAAVSSSKTPVRS